MAVSRLRLGFRISFAVLGTFVGLSAAVCWIQVFKSYDTAAFGVASGLTAAVALTIHILYAREQWQASYRWLRGLMLSGCFVQLAGVCGFVTYLVLGITNHQALKPDSYYITCVWCFLTWKWGFLLFLYARMYRREFDPTYQRMMEPGDVKV
ncbi:heme transporter HRG1-like [Branchiostoma floridae x Branchiostoma japonicum]